MKAKEVALPSSSVSGSAIVIVAEAGLEVPEEVTENQEAGYLHIK